MKSGWAGHVASFAAATPLLDVHAEQVRIPYDGTTLKGWMFAPGRFDRAAADRADAGRVRLDGGVRPDVRS